MPMRAARLRCEHWVNPLGIDEAAPRLSWQVADSTPAARQTAWQIAAASSRAKLSAPDLWDSGRVTGDQCLDIPYAGKRLVSRQRVWWRVRLWDRQRRPTRWSQAAFFEMTLLSPRDWRAQWIGRPLTSNRDSQPCPCFRHEFVLREAPASARLYVTARGLFEVRLNGRRVGNDYFTPGWTDYNKRIPFLTYDVASLLQSGPNALGAILGDGWYAGYLGWKKHRNNYGAQLSLLAQLEISYPDGSREVLSSSPDWKTSLGPILASDFYNGETCDARREMPGWDLPGFSDSAWRRAALISPPAARLGARQGPPVRRQEELPVRALTEPSRGTYIFDLGQNMVGWVRLRLRGRAGDAVRIRYAEVLHADGTLYTENLRTAKATDRYICRGRGIESFEPSFTFHGFRYVEVTGLRRRPRAADLAGIVLHSDTPAIGHFACSNALINRLQKNILWGQKGNFLEVPTDCPQRDERLGWTGDAQVFIRTACFNRNVASFFEKWSQDVEDSQMKDGRFTDISPTLPVHDAAGAAAWADAGVICPWTLYLCYGDRRILERRYASMTRWVEWRRRHSPGFINGEACYGDWLAIDTPEGDWGRSPTPRDLIATAYFAHTANLVARIAGILGHRGDALRYRRLASQVRAAFNREFVTPAGRLLGDTQTSYLLALAFDLLPESLRARAVENLVKDIERRGNHLSTGFVGTPLLAPVLTRFGRADVAYRLLMQKSYPSWLYPISLGATTMWERWNSHTRENGFGSAGMNSLNHYAYGAIGEWLYNTVGGIELDPNEPGYKHIIFRPQPGGGLRWARASLQTRYGRAACAWHLSGSRVLLQIEVPANTRATLILPGLPPRAASAGKHHFSVSQ